MSAGKSFGHFSKDNLEYVFDDVFAPPRFQINFIWNDSMISGVNQFGTGEGVFNNQTMLYNDPRGRVRMIRDGRRYFYIKDCATGEYWNIGLYPKSVKDAKLVSRTGLGYSVFECSACGIKSTARVMIAPDEPVEMWDFTIENKSKKKRSLTFAPFVEWFLGGYPVFSSMYSYLRSTVDKKHNAVLSWNTSDERPHGRYNAFIASSLSFTQWAGSRNDFLGPFGTVAEPKGIIDGKLPSHEAWCEELAGSMLVNIELPPGGKKTFSVVLGSFDTEKEKDRLIEKTIDAGYREKAFAALGKEKKRMVSSLEISTPEKKIDRLVNVWGKQQIKLCTEFGRDGARGFRDTLQDAWGIIPFDPVLAKNKIIETISHQHKDGHGVRGWMPLQPHHYSDGPTWITPAVTAYMKETGDYAFLKEKAPYLEGGEGTVLEHMLRGVRFLSNDLGKHKLVLAHEGDWNDSLNWMGRDGKGESVWTSMALYYSLDLLSVLAKTVLKDKKLENEMLKRASAIKDAIEKYGWDGGWYLAGYSDFGNPVGSRKNKEGRIYLNPQTWAVMTGIATGERKKKCIAAIDKMLESQFGTLTLTPTYTKADKNVGRVTMLLAGMYENGTPYCHGTAFKIVADICAGRPDIALKSFMKVLPDGVNPSSVSGCEPYAFTNQYLGPDNGCSGRSISGWISGTAGWMFRAMAEFFFGVRPDYDGFFIQPSLPSGWDDITMDRTIRGKKYSIAVSHSKKTGKISVTVNGKNVTKDAAASPAFIKY